MGFSLPYGNLNIRIHRDITGEMWFGVEKTSSIFFENLFKAIFLETVLYTFYQLLGCD